MKKIFFSITILFLSLLLVSCEVDKVEYVVSFDSNGGSNVENVVVYEGELINEPKEPSKDGFKFVYWSLNEDKFDFKSEINENITLIALWKKLEIKAIDILTNTNYESLVDEVINFNLKASLDELIVEEEDYPNLKINDLSVNVDFISNFKTYDDSVFLFEFNIKTGEIQTDAFGFYSPIIFELDLTQSFYLRQGNIYASFEGIFLDASDEYKPFEEFIPFMEMLILPELPEDIKEIVEDNLFLLHDYKEYKENAFTKELYDELISSVNSFNDILNIFIDEDLLENSPLHIEVIDDKDLKIESKSNDDLIDNLIINFITEEGMFDELNGKVNLKDPYKLNAEFKLTLTNEEVVLPNLDDYIKVEGLKIEDALNNYELDLDLIF